MPLRVLDLFAGCGGLSLGLTSAGHRILLAVEEDAWAAETYKHNHSGTELLIKDIRTIPLSFWQDRFNGTVDLVAGGPPCQGFSISGKRQYGHIPEGNQLVMHFLDVVEAVGPRLVLIENVGGFRTGKMDSQTPVMHYVEQRLNSLGYEVESAMIQAAYYGVPSLRMRLFVLASLTGFSSNPFPTPTHGPKAIGKLQTFVTTKEALDDLPSLCAGEGVESEVPYRCVAQNAYQRTMRRSSGGVANHVTMNHTPRLVDRFRRIEQGESSYTLSTGESEDKPITVYKTNNQRLRPSEPSLCITANFQSTYVHYRDDRNLTAREAARLMTFPDNFHFKGKRTQMSSGFLKKYGREHEDYLSQYNQIGNAVPPLLAKHFGKALDKLIPNGSPRLAKQLELSQV